MGGRFLVLEFWLESKEKKRKELETFIFQSHKY